SNPVDPAPREPQPVASAVGTEARAEVRTRQTRRAALRTAPRVVAPAEPEPELEPVAKVGTLFVNADRLMGEVFIGEQRVGRTREPILIPAGTYELTIRSQFTEDHVESEVRVEPDQRNRVDVALTLKPRTVRFVGWPDDCGLRVDKKDADRLGNLGRQWSVLRPDKALEIEITCPDGRSLFRRWDYLIEDVAVDVPPRPDEVTKDD
ncbi:MAG: hypothetical protein AAF211_15980, partial [Myxococcota bacterium]